MILWDFDNTLFRTWLHTRLALEHLAKATEQSVGAFYEIADRMETDYSFEGLLEHIGFKGVEREEQMRLYREVGGREANQFLFSGMARVVHRCTVAGNVQGLITRGVIAHQQDKFAAVSDLHGDIIEPHRHFVSPHGVKGEVIANIYGNGSGLAVVDDNPEDLKGIRQHAPMAFLLRVRWSERDLFGEHEGDNRLWAVATSTEEILDFLVRRRSHGGC